MRYCLISIWTMCGDDSIAIPRFSPGVLENLRILDLGMGEVLVPPSTSLYMPKPESDGRIYNFLSLSNEILPH